MSGLNLKPESSEKDELMRTGREQIAQETKKRIEAIKKAADAHRSALQERIEQSIEPEEADIKVCEIRMGRDVEQLMDAIYGAEDVVFGPIRILPAEMLANIFQYHVESGLSPWILAKVSRFWMRTAISTPQLWCYILVCSSRTNTQQCKTYVVDGKKHASIDHWQVCFDTTQFQAALDRSGALHVAISVDHTRLAASTIFSSMVIQALSEPVSKRVRHLKMGGVDLPDESLGTAVPIGRFPALRVVEFPHSGTEWGRRLRQAVSMTSKDLEVVTLNETITASLAGYSFWSQLKRLTLRTAYGSQAASARQGLNMVTQQLASIEHIDNIPYNWPDVETPSSTLYNTRELTLSCEPGYLWRLRLPKLERLIFTATSRMYPPEEHDKLSYPMLKTLVLNSMDSEWPKYTAGAFIATENLTLNCEVDDDTLVSILEFMPSVRNVKIRASRSQDFLSLLARRLRSAKGELLCPNFETLWIVGVRLTTTRSFTFTGVA